MFDSLSEKINSAIKTLKGQGRISDINIAQTVKEIRKALLDADVNYKIAKDITDIIKDRAIGEKINIAVSPGQLFTKIVADELTRIMGGHTAELNLKADPAVILMAGLQGSGKTTFSGKLAKMIKSQGRQVLLVACDVYRPAAIDQLKVIGEAVGVEVYSEPENKNPVSIALAGLAHAKKQHKKVVIVDTAGRLAVDTQMMEEIAEIKKSIKPTEILFVVDATVGQDAVRTAKAFNETVDFTGVVLTKMDGDTRGGAALSIKYEVNKPIKFIGTSEKMEGLDVFHPDRMAQRILGMGDVVSLVERAQQVFDKEETKKLNQKIRKNQFDFNDFLSHLDQIGKLGSIKDVVGMVPGMSGKLKDAPEINDDMFVPMKAIILSMTPSERSNPNLINHSRRLRISRGSGQPMTEVNKLLKQFDDMRKMMKLMNNKNIMKDMMGKMGMSK